MAINFLINYQFNTSLGFCAEVYDATPRTYWLVSDNLWALKALKLANASGLKGAVQAGQFAELIESKLKQEATTYNLPVNSERLPISFMHEAILEEIIPIPNKNCNKMTLRSNADVVKTEVCNGTIIDNWQEYADRLLFMALSCHWQGNNTAANQYFEVAKGMWDGDGINDTATKNDHFYATYKLALLLYTSKILGKRLPFEFELVNRIWKLQRETDGGIITNYFANGTSHGDANTETTSIVLISIFTFPREWPSIFAFYYPWYGTPNVSGYWYHWNDANHNPDIIVDGRRQIAATDYPLLDVYDSNNESLIEKHIEIAKMANISCFVVSWWGIGSFEDKALSHIKNVCEQNDFDFSIYYEATSSVDSTLDDIIYLLDNYGNSSSWYRVDDRPVIYVYTRALHQLDPQAYWKTYGATTYWSLSEDVREPPMYSTFVIHPYNDSIGYVQSESIGMPSNETYSLKVGISDVRNDCPPNSDVGFRIKIKNETGDWETLDDLVVNFNDGWLDLSYDVSSYAGQNVTVRAESYDGGVAKWASEWAAVDYLLIMDSKGRILNKCPYFDNEWKTVIEKLTESGYNPYFIVDFGGYENKVEDFAEYFLNFTDGIHIYAPVSLSMSDICTVYDKASNAAHNKNKTFIATVMLGYDDTEIRFPGYVVDRQNGTYYTSFWSVATACFPDGYVITSFNEWHEGTEIEPSREYGDQYINLTRDIVPEFPKAAILTILIVVTTFIAIVIRKLTKFVVPRTR